MAKQKLSLLSLLMNKWFVLFWLVFGCAYVTVYGALYVVDPFTEGLRSVSILGFLFEPTMTATASIIGKTFFWAFKGWGLFQAISLTLGILYAYQRYGFSGKNARAGKICVILGTACLFMCVMIRSTEEFGLQLVAHWSGALLFGVFYAVALGLLLLRASIKSRAALTTFIIFVAMLLAMIGLLIVLGKSGAIENIPMWGAYLIIFLLGYTNVYKKSLPEPAPALAAEPEREAVAV